MKQLKIFGKIIETKNGGSFIGYSTKSASGKWYTVKFARRCEIKPQELGYLVLNLNDDDYFVKQDGDNFIVWVTHVESYEKASFDNGLKEQLGL